MVNLSPYFMSDTKKLALIANTVHICASRIKVVVTMDKVQLCEIIYDV
jgi:hypothetical protein